MNRRRRSAGVVAEGLEARRILSAAGWAVTGIAMADTEVRAGEEFGAESFNLAAVGGGDGAKYVSVQFALSRDGVVGNEDDLMVGGMTTQAAEGTVRLPTDWPFWMPATTPAGTYRLVATLYSADSDQTAEVAYGGFVGAEVNVLAGGPIDVAAMAGPGLWWWRTPGPFVAGGSMVVGFAVTTTELRHRPVDARVALSVDDVAGNGDDIVLGDVEALAEGRHDALAICFPMYTVTVPQGVAAGTYRLVVVVDPGNEITETDEGNNAAIGESVTIVAAGTGIGLGGIKGVASEVRAGETLSQGSVTVWQAGPGKLRWTSVRLSLSADEIVGNADDIYVGTMFPGLGTLADVGSTEVPLPPRDVWVPTDTPAGVYRLVARLFAGAMDTGSTAVGPETTVLPPVALPDLEPTYLKLWRPIFETFYPGAPIQPGFGATTSEWLIRTTKVRYALSLDDVVGNGDDVIITTAVAHAAGSYGPLPLDSGLWPPFHIPADCPPGRYRLVATVDPDNELAEADETNNTIIGPAVTAAEVVGTPGGPNFSIDGAISMGGGTAETRSIAVGFTLRSSDPAATGTTVTVRFTLSADGIRGNADDVVVGTAAVGIGAGGIAWPSPEMAVPQDVPAGHYTLFVTVDPLNEVAEWNETDNTVLALGGIDLPAHRGPSPASGPSPRDEEIPSPAVFGTAQAPLIVQAPGSSPSEAASRPATSAQPETPRKARLVAKLVTVRREGKMVRVIRVTNLGTAAFRKVATIRVAGQAPLKKRLNLGAGRHIDLPVKLAGVAKAKAIRISVAAERA